MPNRHPYPADAASVVPRPWHRTIAARRAVAALQPLIAEGRRRVCRPSSARSRPADAYIRQVRCCGSGQLHRSLDGPTVWVLEWEPAP